VPKVDLGTLIADKYRVTRMIGAGGMGTVWEGLHVEVGYRVAIKVLRADQLDDPENVKRFYGEARAVAKLRTKHVAKIYDVGQLADGRPYIVMEFLDGVDLEAELVRRKRLPAEEACRHVMAACVAVSEAHSYGIIHRDLKPANLFLAREGSETVLKVVDFGISKVASDDGIRLTQTQSAFGTPLYMAPESVRSAKLADERTDVWALGVILHELVTGHVPFLGESATAVAVAVTMDEPKPPSGLVPDLPSFIDTVVATALQKTPAKRYQSAAEMSAAIDNGLKGNFAMAATTRMEPLALEAVGPPRAPMVAESTSQALVAPVVSTPTPRPTRVMPLLVGAGALVGVLLGVVVWRVQSSSASSPSATTAGAEPPSVAPTSSESKPQVEPERSGPPTATVAASSGPAPNSAEPGPSATTSMAGPSATTAKPPDSAIPSTTAKPAAATAPTPPQPTATPTPGPTGPKDVKGSPVRL
jgi:eukaryotic-like serine/threonine-protein kinase